MGSGIINTNHIRIWYEAFGDKSHPAVLLMMGNSCDAMMWPADFCHLLADLGLYVIRFDQRDTGLSTWVDYQIEPYTLIDMARDAVGLLEGLHIPKAHMIGFSTGGAIALLLAFHYPEKILSLTLMMTSLDLTIKNDAFLGLDTSRSTLPPPRQDFIQAVLQLNAKEPKDRDEKIQQLVANFRLANGKKAPFDQDFFYRLFEYSLGRVDGKSKKGGHQSNHALATSATTPLTPKELKEISVSTLVISGSEDPIFPPPHGEALANTIPHAQLLLIQEMGHILSPLFFSKIATAIDHHIQHAKVRKKDTESFPGSN